MWLFDPDYVEAHNTPASLYGPHQEGKPKVIALVDNLIMLTGGTGFIPVHDKFPPAHEYAATPVVVVALDSREERIKIWPFINRAGLIVDLRSGLDVINVYAFEPRENDDYLASLQSEGEDIPCSARAVAYNSLTAAGLCGAIVKAWSLDEPFSREVLICHKNFIMVAGETR